MGVRAIHDRQRVSFRRHAGGRRLFQSRYRRRAGDPRSGRPTLSAGRLAVGHEHRGCNSHGWMPETGFLPYRWEGYDESLLLYILGLGSPSFPLPFESYQAWAAKYEWKKIYDYEYLYAGPLFTHQFSHLWLDFRGIQDAV